MAPIKEEIQQFLNRCGVGPIGFGQVPENVTFHEIENRFPRVVVFGYTLSASVLATIKDHPTLIYKHHYKTVNWLLDQTAYHLVRFIEETGNQALAIPASQVVDWKEHKGHVSHKLLAHEAGLGFIGRSGLLVHPKLGARVRYVSVLTDADFEPNEKIDAECDTCKKCLTACPAHAISEKGVDILRCYEKLEEFAKIRGIGQHICGVCVKVCDGRNEDS
jgi:epoxyqueuosine reductase